MQSKTGDDLRHSPEYLTLSRMLTRFQALILLTPTPDDNLNLRLEPLRKQTQAELQSPLPFHRTKWLRNIESARTVLLKLEQSALNIKVQRTKREVVKDLAQKRNTIKRLRARVEEIGREVESNSRQSSQIVGLSTFEDDENTESMLDVLHQIRQSKIQEHKKAVSDLEHVESTNSIEDQHVADTDALKDDLFESNSTVRRRQNKNEDGEARSTGYTSGYSEQQRKEESLLNASKEHESITTNLLDMAAQLKQQARQTQFTLSEDKGLLSRALEGLDQNVAAMGIASKGMKTLQRMNEEQGFWGRLKLQLLIAGMWLVAVMLVFIGPKLRF